MREDRSLVEHLQELVRVRAVVIYTKQIEKAKIWRSLCVMATTTGINGIDSTAVRAVADRLRERRDEPVRFAAGVRWLGGYRTEATVGPEPALAGDEPTEMAGTGSGPSPEDLLLGAVGQCLIVGLAGAATARGVKIERLSVDVEGDVNLPAAYGLAGGHPGFQAIRITVHLDADADRLELDALVDHALSRAPIPSTVANPVPVTARLAEGGQGQTSLR
jgi:uncharacterized OsmC-like protein